MRILRTPSKLIDTLSYKSIPTYNNGVSLKLSALFVYCELQSKYSYHEKMYARVIQSQRILQEHNNYSCCWYHHTWQGIRNDDQSFSPVTPLAPLLFLSFLIP